MRKLFSLLAAVLFAGSMMAAEAIMQYTGGVTAKMVGDAANNAATVGLDADLFTVLADKGAASNLPGLNKANDIRLYAEKNTGNGNTITVSIASGTITSIVLDIKQTATFVVKAGETAVTEAGGAYAINATSFSIQNTTSRASTQLQLNKITITYTAEGGETPVEPACKWDEIAFLGNGSGVAAYTDRFKVCTGDPAPNKVVNIQNPGWAAEPGIYVEFPSAAWGAISLAENQYKIQGAGILLYVSAFLYDAETEVTIVCQEVTYTLTVKNVSPDEKPVVKKTCAEVYTLAKNDAVALNDVVVTYVNGKNVWVKDATASMLVFLPADATWNAGDVLSEVAGVVDIYNGVYEVKPSAEQVKAIVATPGEAPAAEVVTEVALTDVNKYIVMQNVEFAEDAAFAEGTQSNITINGVTVRNQFKNGYSFTTGKKYNVYGVVTIYSSTPQVYFITAEEASSTAIDNTVVSEKAIKMFENGQLIIIKNGVKYNALGSVIE